MGVNVLSDTQGDCERLVEGSISPTTAGISLSASTGFMRHARRPPLRYQAADAVITMG